MRRLRDILREEDIQPRKSLGQCFLGDEGVIRGIVQRARIGVGETVIEIGAGVGLMTEAIARQARRVVAVEIDPVLVRVLERRLGAFRNVEIVAADILRCNLASLIGTGGGSEKVKIVGNIPYHLSSPILFMMLAQKHLVAEMILMFQKEVADRLLAPPGTKAYGILSVVMDMYAEMQPEIEVPPECFFPPPRIRSTVLTFRMRSRPKCPMRRETIFIPLVKAAFAHRRKTLFNNLRQTGWLDLSEDDLRNRLVVSGIDPRRRAETLTPEEYALLTDVLTTNKYS